MKFDTSKEKIDAFLSGFNPMEHIIKLEMDYDDDKVKIYYRDENRNRKCQVEPFYPFVWSLQSAARGLFNGNRKELKKKMTEYGISCKGLIVEDMNGNITERMENGYRVMFYAQIPMSFSKFMQFFIDGGRPIYPKTTDKNYGLRDYIVVAPNEQHMISNGLRLFKGYEDYDDLIRLVWDLETEGLDPNKDMISQIGIRTNKGYEKLLKVNGKGTEKFNNEIIALNDYFDIVKDIDPDIISGHNTENFDWYFDDIRLQKHDSSLQDFTAPKFNGHGIYKKKKQSVLKLGGEMEYYYPTVKYGTNITDSLHAVRRAQAIDSSMKKADLKYVTKYSKLNKPNRVYIPGKLINETWEETRKIFAFNDNNGEHFKITEKILDKQITTKEFDTVSFQEIETTKPRYEYIENNTKLLDNETGTIYEIVSGEYIGERYLMDDLYETDKVELRYNQPNFLVGKMLPVSFEKMCTMGTAAIWKYIMLSWSYEHDLAIPQLIETKKFTGGLSRLLSVGYVDRIVKLDYNSLYPSIILSYLIESEIDISGVMNALLEYILSQREHYKELKGVFSKKAKKIKEFIKENPNLQNIEQLEEKVQTLEDCEELIQKYEAEAARNDKMQLPLKIVGNSFFGSYGSGSVFPHSDLICAEKTTCIGRMCLRLMISHFTNIGYKPIVGDSFTGDTPLFIKYNNSGLIDIKPISELINEQEINIDSLGREYDYSKKEYKVLCRSGWVEPNYIYRHKADKPIYRVSENNMTVDVTEDHSLFNEKQEKIKPSDINSETKLEYYKDEFKINETQPKTYKEVVRLHNKVIKEGYKKIPIEILNANKITQKVFISLLYNRLTKESININNFSKTFVAGFYFINK